MSLLPERHDSELARKEREQSPRIGTCRRCCRPWIVPISEYVGNRTWQQVGMRTEIGVQQHETPYTERRACFALCETCWASMTIEERMPYYEQLCDSRAFMAGGEYEDQNRILSAVEKGL